MSKLPDTLNNTMFDKNGTPYYYVGSVFGDTDSKYIYTADSSHLSDDHILVNNRGYIYYTKEVEYIYLNKPEIWVEDAKYADERNRVYTLVKDGRNNPAFKNPYVKLIFLDSDGKSKARDAHGKSITSGYSIVRKL